MEHPLIGDVSKLSIDDLGARVTDLSRKLAIAQRGGNAHLCNQIRMALETFTQAYQKKLKESQEQSSDAVNFDRIINIE